VTNDQLVYEGANPFTLVVDVGSPTTRSRTANPFSLFKSFCPYEEVARLVVARIGDSEEGGGVHEEDVIRVLFAMLAMRSDNSPPSLDDFLAATGTHRSSYWKVLPGSHLFGRCLSLLSHVRVWEVERVFNARWQETIVPPGLISVDETMIPFHPDPKRNAEADDPSPQFWIVRKPHPHGLKVITAATLETATGRPLILHVGLDGLRPGDQDPNLINEPVDLTVLQKILKQMCAIPVLPGSTRHIVADTWFATRGHLDQDVAEVGRSTFSMNAHRLGKRLADIFGVNLGVEEYRMFARGDLVVTIYRPTEKMLGIVSSTAFKVKSNDSAPPAPSPTTESNVDNVSGTDVGDPSQETHPVEEVSPQQMLDLNRLNVETLLHCCSLYSIERGEPDVMERLRQEPTKVRCIAYIERKGVAQVLEALKAERKRKRDARKDTSSSSAPAPPPPPPLAPATRSLVMLTVAPTVILLGKFRRRSSRSWTCARWARGRVLPGSALPPCPPCNASGGE